MDLSTERGTWPKFSRRIKNAEITCFTQAGLIRRCGDLIEDLTILGKKIASITDNNEKISTFMDSKIEKSVGTISLLISTAQLYRGQPLPGPVMSAISELINYYQKVRDQVPDNIND